MIKRLREEWIYWKYRNITRRWQLLRPRLLRLRHQPHMPGAARARGTAMYAPVRTGNGRGLIFVAVVAAVLAVINTLLAPPLVLDLVIFAAMVYAYLQFLQSTGM